MKTLFNKILTVFLFFGIISAPFFASAQALSAGFCENMVAFETSLNRSIAQRQEALNKVRETINDNLQDLWNQQDSNLAKSRENWDKTRLDQYAVLETAAKTDAQKQAVQTFRQEADSAISERRVAIDKAISDFRQATLAVKAARKTAIDSAIAAYKNSVNAALETAKAECSAGVPSMTARQDFVQRIRAAKSQYQAAFNSADRLVNSLQSLSSARKIAVQNAVQNFKTQMETAVAKLRSSFPESPPVSPLPSETP